MKAIVVRQPWATLIALGIKTIETRPAPPNGPMRPDGVRGLPGCSLERGERIAIVAGALDPPESWHLRQFGEWSLFTRHYTDGLPQIRRLGCITPDGKRLVDDAYKRQLVVDLPLGAVVCTVTVDDALPIGGPMTFRTGVVEGDEGDFPDRRVIVRHPAMWDDGETLVMDRPHQDIIDQLPLGDFTPGCWGWLLSDPQPCAPIPCKGRQGVFTLPDDVAARIGGES